MSQKKARRRIRPAPEGLVQPRASSPSVFEASQVEAGTSEKRQLPLPTQTPSKLWIVRELLNFGLFVLTAAMLWQLSVQNREMAAQTQAAMGALELTRLQTNEQRQQFSTARRTELMKSAFSNLSETRRTVPAQLTEFLDIERKRIGIDVDGATLPCNKLVVLNGIDLSGLDLRELDLRFVDFRKSTASGSLDLRGANLRGSCLNGSTLKYANLANANLDEINCNLCDLSNVMFNYTSLRGAKLNFSYLHKTRFFGADLMGAQLCSVYGVDSETDFSALNIDSVVTVSQEVRKFFPSLNAGTLPMQDVRDSVKAQLERDEFELGVACTYCTELDPNERNSAIARWSMSIRQKVLVPESFTGETKKTTQLRYTLCDVLF